MARAPHPLVLAALGLAGAFLCAFSIHVATREGVPDIQVALLQWISVPYIAAGLIAWWRRPASRLGPLMIGVGFSTGLLCLQFVDNTVLWSVGSFFDIFAAAAFIHVTLAFPSGRLRSLGERLLVGAGYAIALGLQVAKLMFLDSTPQNGFGVADDFGIYRNIERVQLYAVALLCLAAVAVLAGRWMRAGRPGLLWPSALVAFFAVGLVGLATLYVFAANGWPGLVAVQRTALGIIGFTPVLFLAGVLDARLARGGVNELVVQLRGNPDAAALQAALARALRDPTLQLVYWLPEFGSYADAAGHEVALPGPGDGRAMTPIQHDGAQVAALVHDPWLTDEEELMAGVTAVAGIALENARLQVELRAHLEELRGSRARIVEVAQEERKRLERNLHDGAQQRLVALSMDLGRLEGRLPDDAPERADLRRARDEIARSLSELREVAHGLHPAVVSAHGLDVALEQLAAVAPLPVDLRVTIGDRLPEPLEVAAYYLVSEGLANVGKHANAGSVRVEIRRRGGAVLIEVADDGVGGADTEKGSGLRGLADRVEALGGRLRVWSPVGGGTLVSAEIPCAS